MKILQRWEEDRSKQIIERKTYYITYFSSLSPPFALFTGGKSGKCWSKQEWEEKKAFKM